LFSPFFAIDNVLSSQASQMLAGKSWKGNGRSALDRARLQMRPAAAVPAARVASMGT